MEIIKRDGSAQAFNSSKITKAIMKANHAVGVTDAMPQKEAAEIAAMIEWEASRSPTPLTVEAVQDRVVKQLMVRGHYALADHYVRYRYEHELLRKGNTTDAKILGIVDGVNAEAMAENSNKNPEILSVQRDYIAGEVSRDITERLLLPEDVVRAHKEGIIHFHDADYFISHGHNCDLINLEDMLQNGTVISGTKIDKPHRFLTACNIATQVVAQVASNQFGGQTISLTHLAPFVDESRKIIRAEVESEMEGLDVAEERLEQIVEKRVRREIKDGIQTIQYQILTLLTTNGQAPFLSVFMYLNEAGENKRLKHDLALCIEEMLEQRTQGVKNEVGAWISPAFPKLLYVLEEDNIRPGREFYYLTEKAVHCSVKRLTPDYISEKVMMANKVDENGNGQCYPCMGCRSFLTPMVDQSGKPKYYGRFNQGVVTISLPDVALSSGKDMDAFWRIFDERLELCHKALRCRHERLLGTPTSVAPILWQHGALARLPKDGVIDELLYNNYSTISLGYAGLYECVKYMTGVSHTDEAGKPFALAVMQRMNDKCAQWRAAENISYSLYGTPMESTTYKFAKCLRKRFGDAWDELSEGRDYITNSYHINVREKISAFEKLKFEAEFQKLSPGGCISYCEIPDMSHNEAAAMALVQYIYENIMYAELNCKSDYCQVCGYDGEIKVIGEGGKFIWECPHCGNRDQSKMNIARRVCGYISTNTFNQGRTNEIADRVLHVSVAEIEDSDTKSGV